MRSRLRAGGPTSPPSWSWSARRSRGRRHDVARRRRRPAERRSSSRVRRRSAWSRSSRRPQARRRPDPPGPRLEAVPLPPVSQAAADADLPARRAPLPVRRRVQPRGRGEKVPDPAATSAPHRPALAGGRRAAGGPHVVVGHSLGSVIAYDVLTSDRRSPAGRRAADGRQPAGDLRGPGAARAAVDTRGRLARRAARPRPWINVYDLLDPVCGVLGPRGSPATSALRASCGSPTSRSTNEGRWRHSISKYLGQEVLRDRVCGRSSNERPQMAERVRRGHRRRSTGRH